MGGGAAARWGLIRPAGSVLPVLMLALDTSASAGVALHDGTHVIAERHASNPRRHAEVLVPFVDQVLREAGASPREVSTLAVGVGPGPFTGLRVGVVTALTLAHVLALPVHGLCSLDALAAQAAAQDSDLGPELLVATDARRREVYWARYALAGAVATRVDGPHVGPATSARVAGVPAVGRGAVMDRQVLPGPDGPLDPSAGWVARLVAAALDDAGRPGPGSALLAVEPLYLRRPDAQEPAARKRVLP